MKRYAFRVKEVNHYGGQTVDAESLEEAQEAAQETVQMASSLGRRGILGHLKRTTYTVSQIHEIEES